MSFPTNPLYNVSSFDGTIASDYLRYAAIPESVKKDFIDYSITDFDSYKDSLLNYIKAVYPDQYTNFVESDMGVMFVELFAYLASVISLKADFLANESYLPTVKTATNLRKLLTLIGVSVKGPAAAKAEGVISLFSDFFSDSPTTCTITKAARTFVVPSDKDGKPVHFTLYKGNSDGTLVFDVSSVNDLQFDVNVANLTMGNFYLMEGQLVEELTSFSTTDEDFKVTLSGAPVVEGSISVSSSDGTLWKETNSLFLASSTETVFEKRYDNSYAATLYFGNGVKGTKPTPGLDIAVFF